MPSADKLTPDRLYFGYWIIAAGFLTQFIAVGMSNYVVGAFMIPMTEEFGWSRAEFSASRSIGQMVIALTGFAIGSRIDRFGGRPFVFAGGLLLAAAMYSLSAISTLQQWLWLNGLLLTVGSAMIGNLVVNVTLGKWFVERRGRAVAVAGMGISLAGILLPPVATALVDNYGWRQAWQLMAVATLFITLPASMVMRRSPEDYGLRPDGRSHLDRDERAAALAAADFARSMTRSQAMRTTAFYLLVLAFGLFQISITVMLLQTIPLLTDAGYSRFIASSMISLASIPAFFSKPFWGVMIDHYSPKKLAALGALVTGLAVMLIVFSVGRRLVWLVYVSYLLMGVGWGGLLPLQEVIWASFFGRRYLGAVRSTAMPFTFGMSAIGPVLVAYYYDAVGNYDLALLAIACCNMASALMLYRMRDTGTRQAASELLADK